MGFWRLLLLLLLLLLFAPALQGCKTGLEMHAGIYMLAAMLTLLDGWPCAAPESAAGKCPLYAV